MFHARFTSKTVKTLQLSQKVLHRKSISNNAVRTDCNEVNINCCWLKFVKIFEIMKHRRNCVEIWMTFVK